MTAAIPPRMPYPGLRSFRREESDLFFGREDCINTMVDRLAASRFLAVLGSSGTGKSSVVKTGLLEALDLGLMAQAGSSWRVVDFRPGGAPLAKLARRLLETKTAPASTDISEAEVDLLRAFLVRGPRSVVEWCGDGHLPEGTNLLLLVDQFEELFRYQGYAGREEAEAFAALLIESARSAKFPIYVALTMRSEYLGACALIEGLAETISTGMFLTPRMTREQCRTAIVGPAAVCGVKIEEPLVNRLLNDLAAFAPWDDRGSRDQLDRLVRRADQLPLLQYCLNRMCVRAQDQAGGGLVTLTLADYERIGGLSGALNAHADEILHGLGVEKLPVAESVFRALIEGSTVSDAVRRPTQLRELVEICAADETAVRAVVDAFRAPGCNFLSPEFDPSHPKPLEATTLIDISHESLIRQWKQLSEWLEKEARSARQWRRLKDRFDDGEPMLGAELAGVLAWWRAELPTAAWIRRYGGDFPAIVKYIHESQMRQRRFAPLIFPLIGLSVLFISIVFTFGITTYFYHTSEFSWPLLLGLISESVAVTCAFGLWQYSGIELRRAVLAGVAILVLSGATGAAFVSILIAGGFVEGDGILWWQILFVAPCALTVMAVFDRSFRSASDWVMVAALLALPLWTQAWLHTKSLITDGMETFLGGVIYFIWFAAIGIVIWLGGSRQTRQRKALLHLSLAVLASSALVLATFWRPTFEITGQGVGTGIDSNSLVTGINTTFTAPFSPVAYFSYANATVGVDSSTFILVGPDISKETDSYKIPTTSGGVHCACWSNIGPGDYVISFKINNEVKGSIKFQVVAPSSKN